MARLTQESILAARQWFHDNSLACIAEVKSGEVRVNDQESYFFEQAKHAQQCLEGKWDHTFTFQQRAYYIQTGSSVPLLP